MVLILLFLNNLATPHISPLDYSIYMHRLLIEISKGHSVAWPDGGWVRSIHVYTDLHLASLPVVGGQTAWLCITRPQPFLFIFFQQKGDPLPLHCGEIC